MVATTSLTGFYLSKGLSEKLKRTENIRRMLDDISTLIRFQALTVYEIVENLSKNSTYSNLEFITYVKSSIRVDKPFYEIWQEAIYKDKMLSEKERHLLENLGNSLGSSDIDGQISSIDLYKNNAEILMNSARDEYVKKSRLYNSLGVLVGVFISIMLI